MIIREYLMSKNKLNLYDDSKEAFESIGVKIKGVWL